MALTMPSDLDTGQGFIPLVGEGNQRKVVGNRSFYRSVAELKTALTAERVGMGINALMIPGEKVDVGNEPGHRIYTQDLATPTNSHCLWFVFPNGYRLLLGSDDNTVTLTNGAPSTNGTLSGNYAWDQATGMLYAWTTSWSVGAKIPDMSGDTAPVFQTARSGASTAVVADKGSIITYSATGSYTLPTGLAPDQELLIQLQASGEFAMSVIRGSGCVMINRATGTDVASLDTSTDGAVIYVEGSNTANKYYVSKVGT